MLIEKEIELEAVREVENRLGANSVLGSYDMDLVCPPLEFKCFQCVLEEADDTRLFLLGEFAKHTSQKTGRVVDIEFDELSDRSKTRVVRVFEPDPEDGLKPLDLAGNYEFTIVCVTTELRCGNLTIIDGNHRSIAYYRKYGHIVGLPAIVCVHPKVNQWPFVPVGAR